MKKIIGLCMAALMTVSLFGCRVTETNRTRIASVPYSTTRAERRNNEVVDRSVTVETPRMRSAARRDTAIQQDTLTEPNLRLGRTNTPNAARNTTPAPANPLPNTTVRNAAPRLNAPANMPATQQMPAGTRNAYPYVAGPSVPDAAANPFGALAPHANAALPYTGQGAIPYNPTLNVPN